MVKTDDGACLWATTSGVGPPLVLCHGGPGMRDYLGPVGALVDDLATVHRFDQRGAGRSTIQGPYAVGRFVADLEMLRGHFGHRRWLVGGHSWGATLALRYALAHPSRVAALLYLSGTGVGSAWRRALHEESDRRLTAGQRRRRDELKVRERGRGTRVQDAQRGPGLRRPGPVARTGRCAVRRRPLPLQLQVQRRPQRRYEGVGGTGAPRRVPVARRPGARRRRGRGPATRVGARRHG
jgi:pimeloyl-ACP methyl ester carboxylesterase